MRIEPRVIIQTLKKNEGAIRKTARELGIHPTTVSNWRIRARSGISPSSYLKESVVRKSTRPHALRVRAGTTIPAAVQDAILKVRKERGYGAEKIKSLLQLEVSTSTIHRFLKKRGKTAPTKNYRRPRLQGTQHMYLKNTTCPGKLQMDIKYVTPELSGWPHTTYLYAIIDIYTRWKYGVILEHLDQSLCIKTLGCMLSKLPLTLRESIDFIQTDNGSEFQSEFHDYVANNLGWKHHHTHKSSPNENAVIERSFRTDEEEFFWRIERRPLDIEELNDWYSDYLHDYNTFRPHLGLRKGERIMAPEEKLNEYFSEGV